MKERPIIFTGPSLPAIMAGRKTQTRRPINVPRMRIEFRGCGSKDGADWNDPSCWGFEYDGEEWALAAGAGVQRVIWCPYGVPGDRLWVRETWGWRNSSWTGGDKHQTICIEYRADGAERNISRPAHDDSGLPEQHCRCKPEGPGRDEFDVRMDHSQELERFWRSWRSPRFMPRWASRLLLEVTEVRVQRLHEISEEDARAEGVELHPEPSATTPYRSAFIRGWEELNGERAPWASNPWVHAVSFKVVS